MTGKLNTFVVVHTDDGAKAFGPDDEISDEVAGHIKNAAVWAVKPRAKSASK